MAQFGCQRERASHRWAFGSSGIKIKVEYFILTLASLVGGVSSKTPDLCYFEPTIPSLPTMVYFYLYSTGLRVPAPIQFEI